jgi:UDP-glucose 4-epimerase
MKPERILLTGGAGFLSSFVIERLRPRFALTLFDRIAPSHEVGLPFIQGDVTSYHDIEAACVGQEAVVHTIALVRERFGMPAEAYADVMVKGTWNLAEACIKQGIKRLVNISSIVACGWPETEDRPCRTKDAPHFRAGDLHYCLAKHLGEEIGAAYHQAHGLSVIHLRPGVIAGDGVNPASPSAPAVPAQHWFVYVDPRDVAQAVELALTTERSYGCYNIVAGRRDSLFDWITARNELGYQPEHNWPEIAGGV